MYLLLPYAFGHHRGVLQACKQYHAMLQDVYGAAAVLEPLVMPVEVLDMSDTAGDVTRLLFSWVYSLFDDAHWGTACYVLQASDLGNLGC